MPPGRPARTQLRAAQNENDENSTRVTRAKTATLAGDERNVPAKGAALQTKRAVGTQNNVGPQRKRAALGDVSNVGKADGPEAKKGAASKSGLVSKAAQPAGVQKPATRPVSRTAAASREVKKAEVKRTGSGLGVLGTSQKRKTTTTTSSTTLREDSQSEDAGPVRKKAHTTEAPERRSKATANVKQEVDDAAEPHAEPAALPRELEKKIRDLDSEDLDDPLMAAEYAPEIFKYLFELEEKTKPNPDYMSYQDDLEWKTRGILIDWLVEVHTRFHLLPETLFLTVNLIDRFLSEKVVQLDRLQLVGITAMFIAAKYEEVLSPHVSNFKHVADDGYSEAEVLSAERFILSTLDFDLSYPNPMNFLRRISKADNYDIQSRTIGKYLMEISLLDHRFMAYPPSQVAAAAMYLARMLLDRGEWDETIAYYAGYSEDEIMDTVNLMVDYLARPPVHEAFYKKYANKKFMKVSMIAQQWARKNYYLFGIKNVELSLDQIS